MPVRKASAIWNGNLINGNGTLKSETGAVEGKYSFTSRFEEGVGTNPEELIAAAHAACYSMALSAGLAKAGYNPIKVETEDHVHLVKDADGFSIKKIEVISVAQVEGIDEEKFQEFAEATKKNCPVSRALTGTEIVLSAKLQK